MMTLEQANIDSVEEIEEGLRSIPLSGSEQEMSYREDKFAEERQKIENETLKQNMELQKEFSEKVFNLVEYWIYFVITIICSQGIVNLFATSLIDNKIYFLSNSIIIEMIRGTAITGLLAIILKGLFQKNK